MVRTTPADRYSNRDSWARSSAARMTSAVPASTATAGAAVRGSSRGNSTRGRPSGYRFTNHGNRPKSLTCRSWSTSGSSAGASQGRPGS